MPCLGLLPDTCANRYNANPERRVRLHAAIEAGVFTSAIAIDDFSAVFYEGSVLAQVYRWAAGAGPYTVAQAAGRAVEVHLNSSCIDGAGT